MNKKKTWNQIYEFCKKIIFPAVLLLYPLRHVRYGVEWWDTGYNYGNFRFLDRMDSMWKFGTYLANVTGNFLTKLPFGDTMAGLNVYTALPVSIMAVGGYFFFTKRVKLPAAVVFAGEFLAVSLCWCPTSLLYNYLTYLLMFGSMICLYSALADDRQRLFVAAGAFLGVNLFVRFPNLAEISFILAVWCYAVIQKKKAGRVLKETGLCILGYIMGAGVIFAWICVRYGFSEYTKAIQRLFAMSSDAADYTVYSMAISEFTKLFENFLWIGRLLPFVLLGVIGFMVLPGKLERLKKAGYLFCILPVFYWLRNQDLFNVNYTTKASVFQWAVMLLSFTLAAGTILIFSKRTEARVKLLCGLSMLTILVTPLGSNNHLYASINNLFFAAPVGLYAIGLCLKRLPEKIECLKGRVKLYLFPVKGMTVMVLLMLAVQSLFFGWIYVFSEGDNGRNLHTAVTGIPALQGMYTSADRAKPLEELYAYVETEGLREGEIILYGYIPALSYYLDMPFAISAWPDLASYTYEAMRQDMEKVEKEMAGGGRAPLVLLEHDCAQGLPAAIGAAGEKELLLTDFMNRHGYTKIFENEKFVLYKSGENP